MYSMDYLSKRDADERLVVCLLVTLLSGARNVKDRGVAEMAYGQLKKLFPRSPQPLVSAAVLLSNVYASMGDEEQASDVRANLNEPGVKKQIGITRTMVQGKVYVSITGSRT